MRVPVSMMNRSAIYSLLLMSALLASCASIEPQQQDTMTLTIIGLNDVHGELEPTPGRGGIAGISGFIDAVRAARAEDGGAVLVIDAGDMWQGTLESNVREGEPMLRAYNAIGVTAAAVGNHEFDFGPVGEKAIPVDASDDPRGALKLRASEAEFPLLAANIIDESTGRPLAWPNIRPSTIVDVQDVKVGIIGVLAADGLLSTIPANVGGLHLEPLARTIAAEARSLRDAGATVVIVTAHAGGECTEFDDPRDLSSCDTDSEIMRLARDLPAGLVDHIIAGHVHEGIAHYVNDIAITTSYFKTRAFSRVDLMIDRDSGEVSGTRVYPPQQACLSVVRQTLRCATAEDLDVEAAVYEGRNVTPNPEVAAIAAEATAYAASVKSEKLGVQLVALFPHPPSTESPVANLMTQAVLESIGGDVAIHNVVGGVRSTLPRGELTFGAVYEMFPFDNRIVVLDISGAELRAVLAHEAHKGHRRAGLAGIRVRVNCSGAVMRVVATRPDGSEIADDDQIRLVANDFLVLGGDDILTPIIPQDGFDIDNSMPLVRDVLVDWFRNGPATLRPEDFRSDGAPIWEAPASLPADCRLDQGTGRPLRASSRRYQSSRE